MCFINNRVKILFTLIFLLVSSGCLGRHKDGSENDLCKTIYNLPLNLPNLALIGTDVLDISTFEVSAENLGSHYFTDIGGAVLTLSIELISNNLVIERTFQEPGEPILTHIYTPVCISNGLIYADHLIGKVVNGGVLLLERKPGVDGIPVDVWIFYNNNAKQGK